MVGIGDKLEYTLTAEEGFELPDTIVIVMDGKTLGEGAVHLLQGNRHDCD